ncbi:alpha/beta fold hydrolase [Tsukamurella sp. 1534]|uniref:alpha/beta fold hydrolase n=1 Tax=Tsukamurella sp. 1534 TaxID=1151061 RepID=UPI0009DA6541|nr:alpha/beta hydrolase [Tsukamurella sp. 1534]
MRTGDDTTGPDATGPAGAARGGGRRRWFRRRGVRIGAALTALAVAAVAFWWRTPSPVGHWDSATGQDAFLSAYCAAFRDMPAVAETRDVRTDFGVVRVYRFDGAGDAAPMLLVPGRASASPVWADNMDSLLRIGDVYTIDLLGEPGMSVQERPIENAADEAAWLDQAIAGIPAGRVNLVGLSIGGWTAANLAVHRPDRITTLTLVDPVFTFDDLPFATVLRSVPASVPWLPKSWRDGFNSYTAGGAPVQDVPVADMIEAGMKHYVLKKPSPARISEEQLGTLAMPVLAIIAGRSVMHDSATAAATARRALRSGTVRVYDGASHAVNGEQPERIAGDVAELVSRLKN